MVSMAVIAALRAADFPDHPYAWVITRDRGYELHGGESSVGVAGPAAASDEKVRRATAAGRPFRLCDQGDVDDLAACDGKRVDPAERGVVYEGLIWTADEPGTDTDFAPLRDYGEPNDGCVEIQYLRDGRWQPL